MGRVGIPSLRPGLATRSSPESPASLADCLRKEVTPLAEVAYPEAYEEYKQTVLALAIGEKETRAHPAARDLWSTQKRSGTAAMLSRTARQAAGIAIAHRHHPHTSLSQPPA